MAGLTTSYLLFLEAAKENGWPIDDERFFRAVTVGFFAPDILRFELGDKQVGNIKSTGRRITHFCGGKMKYPKIEDLKDTIINHKERFCAKLFPGYDQFRKVDPMIKEDLIKEKLKPLFKGNLDNQAYAMGIYSALVIDKYFDQTIQQKLLDIDKNNVSFKASTIFPVPELLQKGKMDNSVRAFCNKLYPRMDQQLINRSNVDQAFFDRVYGILLDYYPSDLLDRAFKPYWRIPSEDLLNKKNNHNPYHEELINYCFNTPTILTWFYEESKCQLAQRPEIIDVVKNYKDANKKRPTAADFETSISTKRQAKVVNLGSVPQAFDPQDTSRKSGEAYPTTE